MGSKSISNIIAIFLCSLKVSYTMPIAKESEILSGEWILLYDDKIVDHSANIEDMLILAEEKFPNQLFPPDKVRITKNFQGSPREKLFDK